MTAETPIKIGNIVDVEITGLQKYGAFVKFGKSRGLIHISEVQSGYIADIHEVIETGQIKRAQIIDIDDYTGKISLSLRTLEKQPQSHHIQRKFHFNNPNNKIGFQPFKDNLSDWTNEQMAYLKKVKSEQL
ncbi:CvfD/Ygs/GSP13 family RNA-binding post-transcriptional regulator [Pseudolactococcus insecticola]|uniref:General stress protein n=1 Tax=Pseudolactococcus insecticola TaxID=2709158 RepID=A0A6A0B4D0_9LACT|nr:CvfD/Ygs/GSP13 family RNA-binding post-transcriptional regulator [Lactococcus insecticola]GFH40190.1 general stress protein [Lactococcus insecticola]